MTVMGDRPDYTGTFGTSHLDVAGAGEGTLPFGTFVTRQLTWCLPAARLFATAVL